VASPFVVVETPAFAALVAGYAKDGHTKLSEDLEWLAGRLAEAPDKMGDHVPGLKKLPLPVFKARCKDSCHRLSASAAWRVYYAIHKEKRRVFLLFLHHKKEYGNPGAAFLGQKIERALTQHPPKGLK
jgi:hypothetical protein